MAVVIRCKGNGAIVPTREYLCLIQHCNSQLAFVTNPLIRNSILGYTDAAAVVPAMAAVTVDHKSIQMASSTEASVNLVFLLEINRIYVIR